MSNFNVRLSFKGEGELTVTLPIIGQISIWNGRDIFLKGATQEIVETLRKYRSIQLEHTLNGVSDGCYRVIEVNKIERIPFSNFRPVAAPKVEHISNLKAQLMKANELTNFDNEIIEAGELSKEDFQEKLDSSNNTKEDLEGEKIEEPTEEVKEDDEEIKELPKNIAEFTVSVGKLKGMKISELNDRDLRKVVRYSKSEVEKETAKKALDILYPQN